jgi:hypothetical protein
VHKLDRREFMIGAGGAVLAGAVSPSPASAQRAQPRRLALRLPVHVMAPDDPVLAAYSTAVYRMKNLPANDRRNWDQIKQIHVDFCPHSNWYFLPWHRAYLISFERICRQMLNDPNFMLPYWDWTEMRELPPAFREAAINGKPNPLFAPGRQSNSALTPEAIDAVSSDSILGIMAETHFENFGSTRPVGQNSLDQQRWLQTAGTMTPLENGPHGTVHVAIGGAMNSMSSPSDPIFFLHHCNLDRLWARWISLGRRNTTNRLWTQFRFNGIFPNPQGQGVVEWNVGVKDVLDYEAFGYTYPGLPGAPPMPQGPGPQAGGPPGPDEGPGPQAGEPPGPQAGPRNPPGPGNRPPPQGAGDQVAATDEPPPPEQELGAADGQGTAGVGQVVSTQLTIKEMISDSWLFHRGEPVKPVDPNSRDPNDWLRDTPLATPPGPPVAGPVGPRPVGPAPAGPRPAGPAPVGSGPAGPGPAESGPEDQGPSGPGAEPPAAGAPDDRRIFTILENVKPAGVKAVQVNVYLNHPNPAKATRNDPHFVGTFGLFGLDGHQGHNGVSIQLDLTRTVAAMRRAHIPVDRHLDIQVVPVDAQGGSLQFRNAQRVRIVRK